MKVPKSIFRQVSPASDIYKLMQDFFINAKDYVQEKLIEKDYLFKIKSAELAYNPDEVNLVNRITYLEFKEKYVIAGMLETRTRFNDLQFTFFRDLSCLQEDL